MKQKRHGCGSNLLSPSARDPLEHLEQTTQQSGAGILAEGTSLGLAFVVPSRSESLVCDSSPPPPPIVSFMVFFVLFLKKTMQFDFSSFI